MSAVSKVVYGQTTLIDLTADTITPAALKSGYTAHNAAGDQIVGTLVEAAILSGTTAPASSLGNNGDTYVKLI